MTSVAFQKDGNDRHLTGEQIAEYCSDAMAIARQDLVDSAQVVFAKKGELIHIAKVEVTSDGQATVLLYRDNGVDGQDESRMIGVSGTWEIIAAAVEVLVDLNTLDDLLDEGEASVGRVIGRYADWHGKPFPIVSFRDSFAVQATLMCVKCGANPMIVYARSGCHHGAFCYVYDEEGGFLADLRNQEYVCDKCEAARKAAS